jgi:hypothetical protein
MNNKRKMKKKIRVTFFNDKKLKKWRGMEGGMKE